MYAFLKKKADQDEDPIYVYLFGLVLHTSDKNFDEARVYYERAAKKGHVLSKVRLHQLNTPPYETVSNPDMKVGLDWLIQAANEGSVYSQYRLGQLYIEGENVTLCPVTSFKWFLLASSNGHRESQLRVASMYETGLGVLKNKTLARSFRLKASMNTSNDEQFGVDVIDYSDVLKEKAMAGYPEDQYAVALCLEEAGDDYYFEAARYYLLAADQGHAESQEMIAIAYFNGFHNSNREPYFDLFIKYAKMGANQGIVDCQIMLADFYLNYEICLPIAHCWFEKAAHMNCAIAQHMLGRMYSEGLGVAKDELKSIHWFERAMENKYDASRDPHSLLYDATRDPHSSLYEDSDFENENNEKVLKSLSPKDKDMQIDECSNCGKTTNLKLCARCQMQKYCSTACQRQHWKATGGHKKFCVSKEERKKNSMSIDFSTRADKDQSSIFCSICIEEIIQDPISEDVILQCRHEFHAKCFQLLCESECRDRCPVCHVETNYVMFFKKGAASILQKSIS